MELARRQLVIGADAGLQRRRKRKLIGINCGCACCAFKARRLRNSLTSVASTPPRIASSPNVMSQSPVLCDCACTSGAACGADFTACGAGLAGFGAAGVAGSKSSDMELIKAAASEGVAWRNPGGSCVPSASAVSAGAGVTSAVGWGSVLGSPLATGAGLAAGAGSACAASGSACAFDFARNERQSAPNQQVLPATGWECQYPRAPAGLEVRQSNASALAPEPMTKATAREIGANKRREQFRTIFN